MKHYLITLTILAYGLHASLYGQDISLNQASLTPYQVSMNFVSEAGKAAVKVVKDSSVRKFDRLRKEAPEKYESYADMDLKKWITMRIEVNGQNAKLFLDNNDQPSLVINDLFHGAGAAGGVGLWVEAGTEGYFSDLKITRRN